MRRGAAASIRVQSGVVRVTRGLQAVKHGIVAAGQVATQRPVGAEADRRCARLAANTVMLNEPSTRVARWWALAALALISTSTPAAIAAAPIRDRPRVFITHFHVRRACDSSCCITGSRLAACPIAAASPVGRYRAGR